MSLLDDLRAVERGSPELGARVLTAVTCVRHFAEPVEEFGGEMQLFKLGEGAYFSVPDPTLTTDAAIALVESNGFDWTLKCGASGYWCDLFTDNNVKGRAVRRTPALALCAALIAVMGVDA